MVNTAHSAPSNHASPPCPLFLDRWLGVLSARRKGHFGKPRGPSNWSRSRARSFTALHMVCWDGWALSRAMGCTFRRPWRLGDITRSKWYHGSIAFEWWTPSRLACVAMSAIPLLSGVVPGISVPSEDHRSVTLDNYLPLSALTLLNWTLLNAQFSRPPNGIPKYLVSRPGGRVEGGS